MLEINGKKLGLYYCNGSSQDLCKLSGSIEKLPEFLTGDVGVVIGRIAGVILVLNHWYVKAAACNGTKADEITMEELELFLNPNDAELYMNEIQEALTEGTKKKIEVKPVPSKKKASAASQ